MKIRELRDALDQLKRLYAAGNAKAAEKDIATLEAVLSGHEDKTVEDFVSQTRCKLARKPAPKKPEPREINEVLVGQWLKKLLDAATDKVAFYTVFEDVKGDGGIRLAEADLLARRYTGYKTKYKTKKSAFGEIEKVFVRRARFENKIGATN